MSQLEITTHPDATVMPGRAGRILALGSVAAFAVFLPVQTFSPVRPD